MAARRRGAPPAGSLTGKVALIRRGTCGFAEKAANAQAAGAAGVVLYNNARRLHQSDGRGTGRDHDSGRGDHCWRRRPDRFAPRRGQRDDDVDRRSRSSLPNPTANLISSFSSYGLAPDLSLKPDIGAPGGSINSTYPLELGGNANISGTSMASPHVAGAAALLLQAKPSTSAPQVPRPLPEQRGSEGVVRQSGGRLPRQRAPPGCWHARYRRHDPVDDVRRSRRSWRSARARRVRRCSS